MNEEQRPADAAVIDEEQAEQVIASPIPITLVSWSEQLLPVLYATTEACCIAAALIALASVHLFGMQVPVVPLWAPFLLLMSTSFLSQVLKMQAFPQDDYAPHRRIEFNIGMLITLQVIMVIIVVWGSRYAGSYALWDLTWLGLCANDLLHFNQHAFSILCVIVISYLFCYYGAKIARLTIDAGQTRHILMTRGAIILIAILLQAVSSNNTLELLMLIPLFLVCTLCTHALAHAIFLRYHHLTGLQSSKHIQDRLLLLTLFPICMFLLLLALGIGLTASPSMLTAMLNLLAPVGVIYTIATYVVAAIAVVIVAPFFWLAQRIGIKTHLPTIAHTAVTGQPLAKHVQKVGGGTHTNVAATYGGILILLVIIVALVILTVVVLRRYRKIHVRIEAEKHENIWSWTLFWSQLRSFFRNLWLRLFGRQQQAQPAAEPTEIIDKERSESEHDVRSIYRAFLAWAAQRNIWHKSDETPSEYKQRVDKALALALVEPETRTVTEIYNATRYGQLPPQTEELEQMRTSWQVLKQKVSAHEESMQEEQSTRGTKEPAKEPDTSRKR
ncbi:DUF4129 domain-containing protein [Ktedonobacteria bacterium brp13]|nr:DUF4129 domain-containing protein [Ktedonobacteria bacterium brp13]